MRLKGCRVDVEVSARHRELADEVAANGGSMTAVEFAHSARFARVGTAHTRRRAETSIRLNSEKARWANPHAHDDGSIWVERNTR